MKMRDKLKPDPVGDWMRHRRAMRHYDDRSRLVAFIEAAITWVAAAVMVCACGYLVMEFTGCAPEPATWEVRQ